jgi:hypothetical protein
MTPGSKLFDLLPALYRLKDAQLAASQQTSLGPLASLLAVIEEQLAVIRNDLDQLYDDQFIETCAPWVIPYIGDLIGYQPVYGVAPAVASPRAEVAHTISFRRRKGTVLALEQLARDVTGWGAHAVEFFQVLVDSQYMKHIRPDNTYAPDLRDWQVQAYMNTGFDCTAHNVDVRRIAVERGRYNIQNIGIFLWSLNPYSLTLSPATPSASNSVGEPQCFRFSPLGRDIPLFTNPVSQGSEITAAATPVNVPDRLLRRVLCQDLGSGAGAVYYGVGNSLAVYLNGTLLNPYQIQVCDLSGPDGSWANLPAAGSPYAAAVDPELGRIALPPPATGSSTPQAQATFYYGFNADMGGGEYSREQGFVVQDDAQVLPFPDIYSWRAGAPYVLGAEIIDSNGNLERAIVPGTSGVAAPAWPTNVGGTTVPADGTVTWQLVALGYKPLWAANTFYALGAQIVDSNGNVETVIAAGTSGSAPPAWPTSAGATVSDGTNGLVWTASMVRYTSLQEALNYTAGLLATNGQIALELDGSGASQPAYQLAAPLSVNVPAGATMEVRGADGSWPMLVLSGEMSLSGGPLSSLVLNGLLVSSSTPPGNPPNPPVALVQVPATAPDGSTNQLGSLSINHCTLVPGWSLASNGGPQYGAAPSLVAAPAGLQISIQRSIVGAMNIAGLVTASLTDSILDATDPSSVAYVASVDPTTQAPQPGGALTLQGCTVVGKVYASLLSLVSDSIFWAALAASDPWMAPLWASRKQQGCVRFSYLPAGAITPRQFECVEQAAGSTQPIFYSLRYGDPGYAKLLPCTNDAIRQGADDGGEMGAFHFVLAPLRETDLRVRMQEYLPVGLEFGIFYET